MSDDRNSPTRATGIRGPGLSRGGPGGMFAAMGSKAKDFKGTMRQLASYLKPFRLIIIVVWILALASTAFTIVGPWIMGKVTDELVTGISKQVSGIGIIDFGRIAGMGKHSELLETCAEYREIAESQFSQEGVT